MNLEISFLVYRKEMLEIFRDRRTFISMVIAPLLIIPLLFSAMGVFMRWQVSVAQSEGSSVAVKSVEEMRVASEGLKGSGLQLIARSDVAKSVADKTSATGLAVVSLPNGSVRFRILEDLNRPISHLAAEKLKIALEDYKTVLVKESLRKRGVPWGVLSPIIIESANVASRQKGGMLALGGIAGYLMLLMMFTGAMYPAIDTAAGEKELRTLECLLCSPVDRGNILAGKIAACATSSFLTAVLSLLSFAASVHGTFGQSGTAGLGFYMNPSSTALVLLAVLPVATLAASAMVAVSLLAKSYKEGQSYMMPLFMLVTFPITVGSFANLELTPALALLPVFNTSLLVKQIFAGSFEPLACSLAFAANLICSAIAFTLAKRIS